MWWSQIAKPFSYHFAFNCIKTITGAGLIGYGIALTKTINDDDDENNENENDENDDENDDENNDNENENENDDVDSEVEDKSSKTKRRRRRKDDDNNNNNGNNNDDDESSSNDIIKKNIKKKYIIVSVTIGFGLFLSLPSLMSQIVWETMIPTITATDIAYDYINVTTKISKIFPKLPQFPKIINNLSGGGIRGGGVGESSTSTSTSSSSSSSSSPSI